VGTLVLFEREQPGLADSRPSCAVNRNWNIGEPCVSGVRPDRCDYEVPLAPVHDTASYSVGHDGPDERSFGYVAESANVLRIGVPQREHRIRRGLLQRGREHLAQSYITA